ncbi:MAG: hypothetical protein JWM88_3247 [Verrucomicrobia bacterium]|nr:hypothetical protein [Verrucomicrobiota bacterium]
MFQEHRSVRQEPGQQRRWFEGDGLDLIVWLDDKNEVAGFQLCRDAHALTWRRGRGFAHGRIDEGDSTPLKNETPIIVPNGRVPWAELTKLFESHSGSLEPPLRDLILARLTARR